MKLGELRVGQGKIDVEAEVIEKGEPRSFQKFGKEGKVCNATLKDDSGTIKLTLKITNGYVSEFQGEKQLSAGRFGKLEVVNGNAA